MWKTILFSFTTLAICVVGTSHAKDPVRGKDKGPRDERPLRIAYFVPTDREPEADYLPRIDRVMTHIQNFYRTGMRANNFGPMTFEVDRAKNKQLNLIMVRGAEPTSGYGRDSQNKVREEVKKAFATLDLDFDKEVVLIFQVLLVREPGTTTEMGGFKGGGDGYKGSAVVFDDIRLDAAFLSSKQPDPYKQGKTIGDLNTGYIGGTAHELGHAFGLAHDAERPMMQKRYGRSLMGRGTHTYGEELRGESPGAFLSAASAAALSLHPLFTHRKMENESAEFQFVELAAQPGQGMLTLQGRIEGTPRPVGLIAYNDPGADTTDYDAVGWPTQVDKDGKFRVQIADVGPGDYSLHIRAFAENGRYQRFEYQYQVDQAGRADVSLIKPGE